MSKLLNILIDELSSLPGIGPKTAQKLAFHILKEDSEKVNRLADALKNAKRELKFCQVCGSFSEEDICHICSDEKRDKETICVVAETSDVTSIEKIREYKGLYHVLNGLISPLDGKGPNDIRLQELLVRLQNNTVKEVIIATNPNVEGEATAMYISRILSPSGILVSRLAYGLPAGGSLDYADEITLSKAIDGRRKIS